MIASTPVQPEAAGDAPFKNTSFENTSFKNTSLPRRRQHAMNRNPRSRLAEALLLAFFDAKELAALTPAELRFLASLGYEELPVESDSDASHHEPREETPQPDAPSAPRVLVTPRELQRWR
jgi:hypothetical protein